MFSDHGEAEIPGFMLTYDVSGENKIAKCTNWLCPTVLESTKKLHNFVRQKFET